MKRGASGQQGPNASGRQAAKTPENPGEVSLIGEASGERACSQGLVFVEHKRQRLSGHRPLSHDRRALSKVTQKLTRKMNPVNINPARKIL